MSNNNWKIIKLKKKQFKVQLFLTNLKISFFFLKIQNFHKISKLKNFILFKKKSKSMTFQIHLATILRFMSMHKSIYTAKPEYYTTTALERDQYEVLWCRVQQY
jgi:hypothetical protein